MPGHRSPHTAAATPAGHPVADTILRVHRAVVIGAAMVVAMVMAGAVAQLAVRAVWAGAVTAATGEPLLPAVDTTMVPAAAAAVIGRRAALRAAGTRPSG